MNRIRNIFFAILLCAACSTSAIAQKYSIEAGFISPKQSGKNFSTNYFNGVRLGVNAEFELKHNFSLLTGALYSVVYAEKMQRYSADSVTYKTYGHFIDVPLRISYSLKLNKNLKLFGFVGPNINIGLAQPRKTNAQLSETTTELIDDLYGTAPKSGTEDLYKNALIHRINFQMGAGGGVQWKNYQLKAGYDFGINSINKIDSSKLLRQSGWYVSLVYQF
ncbi:MAG: hypothetical protein H6Q20_1372 [Bacteroidetes bacterium]|jgi:hypothetical protein|nr:hypothetical protein [Bacteroidota bacterium]